MKHITKRLMSEYRLMYKPDKRTLFKDTIRIAGTAVLVAVILKIVDTGFLSLLNFIL